MSSLSLGDDSMSTDKKEQQQIFKDNNLKLNIVNEQGKSAGGQNIEDLNLEDEISSILVDKANRSSATEMNLKDLQDLEIGPLDRIQNPMNKIVMEMEEDKSKTVSNSQSPNPLEYKTNDQHEIRRNSSLVPITSEPALGTIKKEEKNASSKISAYARLDFENFTFFVQTLQVVLGRKSNDEILQSNHHAVDVHLSSKKAISRRHAKIFYNFGTQRFELSILGRNGAFVDDLFVEKGITVPLVDDTKIQIGDIPFVFVLPSIEPNDNDEPNNISSKPFNPSDAINLRSNMYNSKSPTPELAKKEIERKEIEKKIQDEKEQGKKEYEDKKDDKEKDNKDREKKEKGSANRRNSIISSSIQRRLSNSRRKSLATNSEINDILKELSNNQPIDEEDSDLLDSQIQSILADESNDMDESNLLKLAQFNESAIEEEEDEIDKLVQQHNLEQGVNLDEDELDTIDMDLSVLDQEIATLAPLIDAHHQELMKEKEEKRKKLEQEKRKKQQLKKASVKPSFQQQLPRSTPLMGKPAIPRMGRPASIQPPVSRLYGRQLNALTKTQLIDNRLTTTTLTGLPTHLVGSNGLPLKLSQGIPMVKSLIPPRPPAPKLEVPINTIKIPRAAQTKTPAITISSKVRLAPICAPKLDEPSATPKLPRRRKEIKKLTKNVYTLDEIPEQYRTKPTISYPLMITNVLKSKAGETGLTINEINEAIKEIYPYYKYCPDGWQFSVSHNITSNKIFKKVNKEDNEWSWVVDESFINEREKVRKKQQEIAAAKAKAAALRAEELKQKQRLEAQQAISHNIVGRNFVTPYGSSLRIPQSQFISQLQQKQINGQKPKTIAELASEIRRDGLIGSKAPLYFKPQSTLQVNSSGELVKRNDIPASISGTSSLPVNIKAQLAANRSQASQSPPSTSAPQANSSSPPPSMNQDTKKSLAYLQKELFTLYKARKLSYNTATTTEIITKALATTIAQVNVIGAKAGCGDNALSFLVEKAPQQVSKILDIALTKSIKEKQGVLSARPSSRDSTPGPYNPTIKPASPVSTSQLSTPNSSTAAEAVSTTGNSMKQEEPHHAKLPASPQTQSSIGSSLAKPPSLNPQKPLSYKSDSPSLSRPPNFTTTLSKPPSFSKLGGLSKPPQFLSNKLPQRPSFNRPADSASTPIYTPTTNDKDSDNAATSSTNDNKRELNNDNNGTDNDENPKKLIKIE